MNTILTTITPVWNRPEMLLGWVTAIKEARMEGVQSVLCMVGEGLPKWWTELVQKPSAEIYAFPFKAPSKGIGFYHNWVAEAVKSEWVMKLDIDTVPNPLFFRMLLPLLASAKPREWFNAGMVFVDQGMSEVLQGFGPTVPFHNLIVSNPRKNPIQATNFICRRADYLALGGCLPTFQGWGWEDYQQIYMLEKHQQGKDPLPGAITLQNITQRCRDEISKPKAMELFQRDRNLALLHRWHPPSNDPTYKSKANIERNRQILLEYILQKRNHEKENVKSTAGPLRLNSV